MVKDEHFLEQFALPRVLKTVFKNSYDETWKMLVMFQFISIDLKFFPFFKAVFMGSLHWTWTVWGVKTSSETLVLVYIRFGPGFYFG